MSSIAERLATDGFAICRGAVSKAACVTLRAQAISTLKSLCWSPHYNIRRFGLVKGGKIRRPWRRHAVPMTLSVDLKEILTKIAPCLLGSGLPCTSNLVELSAAITLSGAKAQDVHTDILPDILGFGEKQVAPLVTTWIALQPILDDGMGPTVVYPNTHRRFAARAARIEMERLEDEAMLESIMWSSLPETVARRRELYMTARAEQSRKALQRDEERELQEFGPLAKPVSLFMDLGDVAIMDCRIAHCGSAYPRRRKIDWLLGSEPRVILNATFAAPGRKFDGFTYHTCTSLPSLSLNELHHGL